MPPFLLLAQQPNPAVTPSPDWLQWLFVWGETGLTDGRWFGPFITWAKVVGLFALLAWVLTAIVRSARPESIGRRGRGLDSLGRAGIIGTAILLAFGGAALFQALDQYDRLKLGSIGPLTVPGALATLGGLGLVIWADVIIWMQAFRARKPGPIALASLVHLAIGFGVVVGFLIPGEVIVRQFIEEGLWRPTESSPQVPAILLGPGAHFLEGLRLGATYAGLVVLGYFALAVFHEVVRLRWRRIYAIAWQTIVESTRRMWAPWVVLTLFVVILAFLGWFLRDNRVAELAKLFVGSLSFVISLLLTLMIVTLAPISLPNDIRHQTIYTVVSKPVRRLELIWGRLLGYMVIVTVLVLVFGGVSLLYLDRVVGSQIDLTRGRAREALADSRIDEARQLDDSASQLAYRMSARLPLYAQLTFIDSQGQPKSRGINVGMEQVKRSHIEGATPSKAIWRYGIVADPLNPAAIPVDTRLDVDSLLRPDSIEAVENRLVLAQQDLESLQAGAQTSTRPEQVRSNAQRQQQLRDSIARLQADYYGMTALDKSLRDEARALRSSGDVTAANQKLAEADKAHSRAIPIEMTFNIYRISKGQLGEAVKASITVTNPFNPKLPPARIVFDVREYYTVRQSFPSRMLVGSRGALEVVVQCITPSQYLGMAREDFYILSHIGGFRANYLRGLSGIWLQTLVLSAIGLLAGTFLSWPVAILLTMAAYLAGMLAVGLLGDLARNQVLGGGPFESLIRLLAHNNQMSELTPTIGVILAKTFDQLIMPFLARLPFLIPNLSALDVSNKVALGFAVTWGDLFQHIGLGLAYAVPFSVVAYFILKNREVAA